MVSVGDSGKDSVGKSEHSDKGSERGGNSKVENKENKESRHIDRGDHLLAGMEGRLGGEGGGGNTECEWF